MRSYTFLAILLALGVLSCLSAEEPAKEPAAPPHIGTSNNYLAGIDLKALPYMKVNCSINDAKLDPDKLNKIVKEMAAGRGIKLIDRDEKKPTLGFKVHTAGGPQNGYAFLIQATIFEPITVERRGKKFGGVARTWNREVLGHFPLVAVTEEQIGEGIAILIDMLIEQAAGASLSD